jgi:hypothetical protein
LCATAYYYQCNHHYGNHYEKSHTGIIVDGGSYTLWHVQRGKATGIK